MLPPPNGVVGKSLVLVDDCGNPVSEASVGSSFSNRDRPFDLTPVGDAFVEEVTRQVIEDIPIWKWKGHVSRPALADTDGPYLKFRTWASQFYAEGVELDQEIYPPNRPDRPRPEPEGTHKATASSRLKDEDVIRADMMAGKG